MIRACRWDERMTALPASLSFPKWEVIFSRVSNRSELGGIGVSNANLSFK